MAEFKMSLVCMWSKDGSFEKFKTKKSILKMVQSNDDMEPKEKLKKKLKKSKGVKETPGDLENTKYNLTSKDIDRHDTNPTTELEKNTDLEDDIPQEKAENTKKSSPKLLPETPMEEDTVVGLSESTSPHFNKNNPRRSMRTPKPIKRTPEETKHSVKKLTVTASKVQKSTPKGTPKKSKVKP